MTDSSMIAALRASGPGRDRKRTNLSRTHIYRLGLGEIRRPSFETYERIQRLHT
jgi:hypothetical protein